MPWEQVEEDTVSILQHEPEPEFGVAPATPDTTMEDEAASPSASAGDSTELDLRTPATTDVKTVSEPTVQTELVDETEVAFQQGFEEPDSAPSASRQSEQTSASALDPSGMEQATIPLPPPETNSVLTEEPTLIVQADVTPDQETQTQKPHNSIQEPNVSAPCAVDSVEEALSPDHGNGRYRREDAGGVSDRGEGHATPVRACHVYDSG